MLIGDYLSYYDSNSERYRTYQEEMEMLKLWYTCDEIPYPYTMAEDDPNPSHE